MRIKSGWHFTKVDCFDESVKYAKMNQNQGKLNGIDNENRQSRFIHEFQMITLDFIFGVIDVARNFSKFHNCNLSMNHLLQPDCVSSTYF